MLVARRFLIAGRVQGVGFRFFVEEAARHEGVGGWVRNLPDGRVEVLAEGEVDAVDRVENKIRRGPPGARVEALEANPEAPSSRRMEFEIK
jgi:acylphosphatase